MCNAQFRQRIYTQYSRHICPLDSFTLVRIYKTAFLGADAIRIELCVFECRQIINIKSASLRIEKNRIITHIERHAQSARSHPQLRPQSVYVPISELVQLVVPLELPLSE